MKRQEKHGMVGTREYRAWADMLTRCRNSKFIKYKDYGGRGIKVCQRWQDSFLAFFEYKGKIQCLLDWANEYGMTFKMLHSRLKKGWTMEEAISGSRLHNPEIIEYLGNSQTITCFSKETGIPAPTIRARIRAGWTTERTLTTPSRKMKCQLQISQSHE